MGCVVRGLFLVLGYDWPTAHEKSFQPDLEMTIGGSEFRLLDHLYQRRLLKGDHTSQGPVMSEKQI